MDKGQLAMAEAMLRPEPASASDSGAKGGRGKKASPEDKPFGHGHLYRARLALKYSLEGDLVRDVMSGAKTLDHDRGVVSSFVDPSGDRRGPTSKNFPPNGLR